MAFRYSGRGWRVAASIKTFGEQIHAARGHRISYTVDGTLGDAEHSSRVSDHNPDSRGIVRALDFYEHKAGFVDAVADAIRLARDARCKYFIHDQRMFSSYPTSSYPAWTWRPYSGRNGHPDHGHLSVVADDRAEQDHPWPMPGDQEDNMRMPPERQADLRTLIDKGLIAPPLNAYYDGKQSKDLPAEVWVNVALAALGALARRSSTVDGLSEDQVKAIIAQTSLHPPA